MSSSKFVSIGLPVYNGEKFVSRAIDAILKQDFENFELIISDNCSSDSTYDICQDFANKDKRIKFTQNKANYGGLYNFQKVLDSATGDYFMWASHDDLWSKNYLSLLVRALESESDYVLAFSNVCNIDDSDTSIKNFPSLNQLSQNTKIDERLNNLMWFEESEGKANLIYGIVRSNVIKKIGAKEWNSYGNWGSDYLLIFNIALYGDFIYVPNATFYKRLTQGKSVSTIEYFKLLQGYFQGYRRIIESSELSEDSKILLLSSVSVKETQWYTREFGKTSFIELKDFIHNFSMPL